jgi:hypothetical protein
LKSANKHEPLLPIISSSADALASSPLLPLINGSDQDEDAVAQLLNPTGPWTLNTVLDIPDCARGLQFSNKHHDSHVSVTHNLKIVMRVGKFCNWNSDGKEGRKLYDIIVETPIHILSCRCSPEWISLPTYSLFSSPSYSHTTCACNAEASSRRTLPSANALHPTPTRQQTAPPALMSGFLPASTDLRRHRSGSHRDSHLPVLPLLQETSSEYVWTQQFARLVSGQESEAGEAPPSYEAAAASDAYHSAIVSVH